MKKNIPLVLIFMVVFVDLLGFGLLIPILPTFATKVLKVDEFAVGLTLAVYSLVQFIFNPFFGSLSDKYGRRKIILYTLLLNAIGYLLFSVSTTFLLLILSRIIAGIGGSSIGVAQAYIADVTTKEERSRGMGLIGVAFGLGFVFGPILGGILAEFGYVIVGIVSASFSIIAFLMSLFYLPETREKNLSTSENKRKIFDVKTSLALLKRPSIGVMISLFFIITFSVANIYGTFALLGYKVYNFSDLENGYIFGIVGIVGAIIQGGLVSRLSKKFSDLQLITFGALFMMFGLGFLPYGVNFIGIAIVSTILSIGTGILQPIVLSLISKVTPENEQGSVLGVNQSFSAFARMLGPLWGGFAFEYLGYQIPFLTGAFFSLLIIIFSFTYLGKLVPTSKGIKG